MLGLTDGLEREALGSTFDLPTWVPDWTLPNRRESYIQSDYKCVKNEYSHQLGVLEACGGYDLYHSRRVSGELLLKGRAVDRVLFVSGFPPVEWTLPRCIANVTSFSADELREVTRWFDPYLPECADESTPCVRCRQQSGCEGLDRCPWRRHHYHRLHLLCGRAMQSPKEDGRRTIMVDGEEQRRDFHEYVDGKLRCARWERIDCQTGWMRLRRLALTEGGNLCLINSNAKPGDDVAILHGSAVPLILRWRAENRYQLVGEAIVDGMMHGEMVTWAEEEADDIILI